MRNFKGYKMATKAKKPAAKKTAVKAAPVVATPKAPEEPIHFEVNRPIRVKGEKYAGLVGTVLQVDHEALEVLVQIQGVKDGGPVDVLEWFASDALEAV
jgi:transcription antitermination factor NusG